MNKNGMDEWMIDGFIEKDERIYMMEGIFPIGWPLGSKTAQNIVRLEVGEVSGLEGRPRRGCLGFLFVLDKLGG